MSSKKRTLKSFLSEHGDPFALLRAALEENDWNAAQTAIKLRFDKRTVRDLIAQSEELEKEFEAKKGKNFISTILAKKDPAKYLLSLLEKHDWSADKVAEEVGFKVGAVHRAVNSLGLRSIVERKRYPEVFTLDPKRKSYRLDWSDEIEALTEAERVEFEQLTEVNLTKKYTRGIAQRRALNAIYVKRGYGFKKDSSQD